ncbi:MAG: hypothetical protein KF764_13565 [Labilithrix sp.]|nr:hypothetical protein [Labilithrix sp.]
MFLGGFECACPRIAGGRRLDLLATTRHDAFVAEDYARLRNLGMTACRDGAPWALVERAGRFDFARFAPMVQAARRHGVDVVWDLTRFGWPDDLDPFGAAFPVRFGRYASAFARWLSMETDRRALVAPVSQASFLAWAGGDVRVLNPFEAARGVELKAQLVRATIEAIEAIRLVIPGARFLQAEPLVDVVPSRERWRTRSRADADGALLQYQAWEMLTGRVWPSLGGHPRYLDIVGVDHDPSIAADATTVERAGVRPRPLAKVLLEVWQRYGRPMIVSETGGAGVDRAPALRAVSAECVAALRGGCELHGVTLYPIVSHPRWVDERPHRDGLWTDADEAGHREPDPDLLGEVLEATPRLEAARATMLRARVEASGGAPLDDGVDFDQEAADRRSSGA